MCIQGRAGDSIAGMRDCGGSGSVVAMVGDLRVRSAVLMAEMRGGGGGSGVFTMA